MKKFLINIFAYSIALFLLGISLFYDWLTSKINLKLLEQFLLHSNRWFVLLTFLIFGIAGYILFQFSVVFSFKVKDGFIYFPFWIASSLGYKLCWLFFLPRIVQMGNQKLMSFWFFPPMFNAFMKIKGIITTWEYYLKAVELKKKIFNTIKEKKVIITEYLRIKRDEIFLQAGLKRNFFSILKRVIRIRIKQMKRNLHKKEAGY